MKVKILKNVVAGGKVHKKDQVVDLDRKTATALVDGEFAEPAETAGNGGLTTAATGTEKQQQRQQ